MTRNIKFVVATALAFSAISVLPAGASASVAAAAEPATFPAAAAESADEQPLPLLELVTPDLRGRFYTLNADEAAKAERDGFKRTDESKGISLFEHEVPGTVAVHRFRYKGEHQAYLLASDPAEIEHLRDAPEFEHEDVVGYIHENAVLGETRALARYTKDGDWRVARADRLDLIAAGYRLEGTLGHFPQG